MRTDVEAVTEFKPFRLPTRVADRQSPVGRPTLHPGDFVWWTGRDGYAHWGRVYGVLRRRVAPRRRTGDICVIVFSASQLFYERWITKLEITQVARATPNWLYAAQWFFSERFLDTPEEMARDCFEQTGAVLRNSAGGPVADAPVEPYTTAPIKLRDMLRNQKLQAQKWSAQLKKESTQHGEGN